MENNNVNKLQSAFGSISEEEALRIVEETERAQRGEYNKYLILIEGSAQDGSKFRDYHYSTGRQSAYDFIKNLLEISDENGVFINTTASKILVEPKNAPVQISLSNMLSIHRFMDEMKSNNKVVDNSGFDIFDYYDENAEDISFDEGDADYI